MSRRRFERAAAGGGQWRAVFSRQFAQVSGFKKKHKNKTQLGGDNGAKFFRAKLAQVSVFFMRLVYLYRHHIIYVCIYVCIHTQRTGLAENQKVHLYVCVCVYSLIYTLSHTAHRVSLV
jgi:hypothetical protein